MPSVCERRLGTIGVIAKQHHYWHLAYQKLLISCACVSHRQRRTVSVTTITTVLDGFRYAESRWAVVHHRIESPIKLMRLGSSSHISKQPVSVCLTAGGYLNSRETDSIRNPLGLQHRRGRRTST